MFVPGAFGNTKSTYFDTANINTMAEKARDIYTMADFKTLADDLRLHFGTAALGLEDALLCAANFHTAAAARVLGFFTFVDLFMERVPADARYVTARGNWPALRGILAKHFESVLPRFAVCTITVVAVLREHKVSVADFAGILNGLDITRHISGLMRKLGHPKFIRLPSTWCLTACASGRIR